VAILEIATNKFNYLDDLLSNLAHYTTVVFLVEVIGEKDSCGGLDLAKGTVP
jgi:hypothetical protein